MKLGIKDYVIIILSVSVIIAFMLGQRRTIDYREGELQRLHEENELLEASNDSLAKVNEDLDKEIAKIQTEIVVKEALLRQTNKEITRLNDKRDEIPTYVTFLSANGVATELSNYITRHK